MSIFSGVKAAGVWTVAAGHLADAETLKIGAITYRLKTTTAQAYDVYLPAGGDDAADVAAVANLILAINASSTAGEAPAAYYAGTLKHKNVKAAAGTTTRKLLVTALMPGTEGNQIVFVDAGSNSSVDGATLGTAVAGTGSAHADLTAWATSVLGTMQVPSDVETELNAIGIELA